MASKTEAASVLPGETLLVIPRSPDELTLKRGERVELVERDDEFGDGWYLGKHTKTGATGLFPEVYTTRAPPKVNTQDKASTLVEKEAHSLAKHDSAISDVERPRDESATASQAYESTKPTSQPPLASSNMIKRSPASAPRLSSTASAGHHVTSPVMNETLSVIEEHITDMNTPRSSYLQGTTYQTNDADFLRSSPNRLSYINGHETDEEDDILQFTEAEVRTWTPSQVAEQLEQLGADSTHCQVFQEQEISGDVLLEMDRDTIMMKEFDLGTLGRRLQLLQKIQRFQTEVKGAQKASRHSSQRSTQRSIPDLGTIGRDRSASGSAMLPRIPSLTEDDSATNGFRGYNGGRQRSQSTSRHDLLVAEQSTKYGHASRPSGSSIRSLPHNRRHSSIDYTSTPNSPQKSPSMALPSPSHAKHPSLDQTWTMANNKTIAVTDSIQSADSIHGMSPSIESSMLSPQSAEYRGALNHVDLDRGYFSSNETESRSFRNVLKKRDGNGHGRAPSDSHGSLRLSGVFRHMRSGSTDSVGDSSTHGSLYTSFRGQSKSSLASKDSPIRANREDSPSIDSISYSSLLPDSPANKRSKPIKPKVSGLKAISDAVTGSERTGLEKANQSQLEPSKDLIRTPQTDSSSQSIVSTGKSVSFEEKNSTTGLVPAKYISFPTNPSQSRRKAKHETSAYTRGLEKKTPAEQIAGSDYSGWMRKKSKKLGKWHSRLFVLRGRRLSYYYSEDDQEEKGLIDISFHRVLPANKDLITGFHATLTGAGSTSITPEGASLQTAAQLGLPNDAADAGIFIFKLVPPRPGMAKAVSFTQPKVHFFAVSSLQEGRNWMAALMKATIERDELKPITSTYKEKTISLTKAKELKVRPIEFTTDNEEENKNAGVRESTVQ